jgi:hypothetical protein
MGDVTTSTSSFLLARQYSRRVAASSTITAAPRCSEVVIPVLTVKLKTGRSAAAEKNAINVIHDFDAVTNRIFSVKIELGSGAKRLFDAARIIRPIILSGDRLIAKACIAVECHPRGGPPQARAWQKSDRRLHPCR